MNARSTTRLALWGRACLLFALLFSASVCGDDETSAVPGAVVSISGAHGLAIGQAVTLTATTKGASDSAYTWQSADPAIASVDAAGMVTGVAAGETVITATGVDSGARGEHAIVVTEGALAGAVVTVTGNPFVEVGETVTLTATTTGATDNGYSWSSSDEAIAVVSDDGVVTGVSSGDVTITATGSDSGQSGSMAVAVRNEVPHYDEWAASAHADTTAEAFNHWNDEMPAEVPASCARCHSTPGYLDYLGADGSTPEQVDSAAPIGTVIECGACHNAAASELDAVTFPSGEVVDALGAEARCMVCHQGRASSDDVEEAITTAAVTSADEPSTNLHFLNIHYYAAGATLMAGRVRGGYQYAGQVYDWRFRHAPGYETCIGCHDPHSLEVKVDECASCHTAVSSLDDLKDIRMIASLGQDYDGDGNQTEGIYFELQGLRALLLSAIQAYTLDQGLGAICYDELAYPYWFKDTDGDGSCAAGETTYDNRFAPFTARLLRATYNFQVATKDPGGFAHNAKYLFQLLYDSAADINQVLSAPIDMQNAVRNDSGHFNGASEAARHWDEDEEVSASCSKCHGGSEGFRFYLKYGVGTPVVEPDNGLDCATCHDTFGTTWDVVTVDSVLYPSGITITDPGQVSNICSTCHAGRESKKTIDDAIAANKLGFRNVHYLPAAAVKKGTEAKVGYEYPSKSYAGEWTTHGKCVDCHDPLTTNHSFLPADNPACTMGCHAPTPIENVRTNHVLDYDGDASSSEPLAGEIAGLATALLVRMAAVSGSPALCYDEHAHPYFFKDVNASGPICDTTEATNANRFGAWTPALMKAAHNFQISQKEPGAWAHNFDYMAQLLYDSIEDLGGDVSGYIRP